MSSNLQWMLEVTMKARVQVDASNEEEAKALVIKRLMVRTFENRDAAITIDTSYVEGQKVLGMSQEPALPDYPHLTPEEVFARYPAQPMPIDNEFLYDEV